MQMVTAAENASSVTEPLVWSGTVWPDLAIYWTLGNIL